MLLSLPLLCLCISTDPGEVQTKFVQVHPSRRAQAELRRTPGQQRAVVLIPGLSLAREEDTVAEPGMQIWQYPGSPVIQALAGQADVFSFAYGQNVPVDRIAELPALRERILSLKKLGYGDIVLLGHSAGGIIARQFAEDHPDAGVTRVVQVCTPNGGSVWAELPVCAPSQRPFLASLTVKAREKALKDRVRKNVPKTVQWVCVMGTGAGRGDVAVSSRCQWTPDLQQQGVPVIHLRSLHFLVMNSRDCAACLADAACRNRPRWSEAEVLTARQSLRR